MNDLKAAMTITFMVAEAIRDAGEIPEGAIYAALIGKVTLDGFYTCLQTLERSGLVKREPCHLVRWVGPSFTD